MPEVGGDTLFANMEAAYASLDDATKEMLDGLYAIHDNQPFLNHMRKQGASTKEIEALREKFPPAGHPVVRTHPVSKRKSIYVNRIFTRRLDGMSQADSDALLEKLFLTAWNPDHQCRFRWRKYSSFYHSGRI